MTFGAALTATALPGMPERTEVSAGGRRVAVLTRGARTVVRARGRGLLGDAGGGGLVALTTENVSRHASLRVTVRVSRFQVDAASWAAPPSATHDEWVRLLPRRTTVTGRRN
ncbi:hypothetical protein [Streptomyces acidiscabies]|uniref:hypothetical protein n=1 Tax=Streptomyces acidiscabies TaxID=42234 RepID=UPI00117DC604|nr:hypothetical protein [Streptomyces acidiscabies]